MTYIDSTGRCLFSDPYKTLNAKRAPCRIFECKTWWYVKKKLGFKMLAEQTAAFAVYVINWLVFKTVVESVYSAVRTDAWYKADYFPSLKG
jgi:hypothetical protein